MVKNIRELERGVKATMAVAAFSSCLHDYNSATKLRLFLENEKIVFFHPDSIEPLIVYGPTAKGCCVRKEAILFLFE